MPEKNQIFQNLTKDQQSQSSPDGRRYAVAENSCWNREGTSPTFPGSLQFSYLSYQLKYFVPCTVFIETTELDLCISNFSIFDFWESNSNMSGDDQVEQGWSWIWWSYQILRKKIYIPTRSQPFQFGIILTRQDPWTLYSCKRYTLSVIIYYCNPTVGYNMLTLEK